MHGSDPETYTKEDFFYPNTYDGDDWDEEVERMYQAGKKAAEAKVPTAADYRLAAHHIKSTMCMARKLVAPDKRWKNAPYYEKQCVRKPVDGEELCVKCCDIRDKELADDKLKHWNGLITEEPLETSHMLGTAWAAKCVWLG